MAPSARRAGRAAAPVGVGEVTGMPRSQPSRLPSAFEEGLVQERRSRRTDLASGRSVDIEIAAAGIRHVVRGLPQVLPERSQGHPINYGVLGAVQRIEQLT